MLSGYSRDKIPLFLILSLTLTLNQNRTSKMSKMSNFTKYIEVGRLNGTNITGSIAEAGNEMANPDGIVTFITLLVIAVIFMLTIALIALTLIVLVEPPRSLSNLRFLGDMEMRRMGNSPPEKSPVPMQGGWYGGSVIRI